MDSATSTEMQCPFLMISSHALRSAMLYAVWFLSPNTAISNLQQSLCHWLPVTPTDLGSHRKAGHFCQVIRRAECLVCHFFFIFTHSFKRVRHAVISLSFNVISALTWDPDLRCSHSFFLMTVCHSSEIARQGPESVCRLTTLLHISRIHKTVIEKVNCTL